MSKIDSNVYALSIQLSLESSLASATLDDFSRKVVDFEQQVSASAQKSLTTIGDLANTTTESTKGLETILKSISTFSESIGSNFQNTTKELEKQLSTQIASSKLSDKNFDISQKMSKLLSESSEDLQEHLKHSEEFNKDLEKTIELITTKNAGHTLQNELLRNDVDIIDDINDNMAAVADNVDSANNSVRNLDLSLRSVLRFIREIDADTEKFVTANYRAYDSQEALLQSTRNLAMTTGVLYGEALRAYVILGNLKAPQEELAKYAEIVAKTSRFTGVSTEITANYANKLRLAGFTTKDLEERMARAGSAMNRFGLSTSDVTALMNININTMQRMSRIFGSSVDDIKKFESGRETLAGFAKSVGHSAESLNQFHDYLANDVAAMIIFKNLSGTVEQGVDGMNLAVLRSGIAMNKELQALEALSKTSDAAAATFRVKEQQKIDLMFGGSRAAYEAARAMGKLATENGIAGKNIAEFNKVAELQAKVMNDHTSEANQTLTRQLAILGSTLWVVAGTIGNLIGDFLYPFVYALNYTITSVSLAIGAFNEWFGSLFKFGEYGKTALSVIKFLTGGIIAISGAMVIWTGGLATIGTMILGFIGSLAGITLSLAGITAAITAGLTTIGAAFAATGAVVAAALTGIGAALRPVIVPLLALGATFLLVGAGAYLFAQAINTISKSGKDVISIGVGLTVAIGTIGGILVGLGYAAIGAAPGLIILSVSMAALSIAAIAFGYALSISSDSIVDLSKVLNSKLITDMFLFSGALVSLGISAIIAAPGLALLGLSMIGLSVSAGILATAFTIIGSSFKNIDPSIIITLATGFMTASTIFLAASTAMLTAGGALAVAGVTVTAGAVGLLAGSVALIPASVGLLLTSYSLQLGANILSTAAVLISQAGSDILIGGSSLLTGATNIVLAMGLLLPASVTMIAVGAGLTTGAGAVYASTFILSSVGSAIKKVGDKLFVGSVKLSEAVNLLLSSALNISQAGTLLDSGSKMFVESLNILAGSSTVISTVANNIQASAGVITLASSSLLTAGYSLLTAGYILTPAASMLMLGSTMLLGSGQNIIQSGDILSLGVSKLSDSIMLLSNTANQITGLAPGLLSGSMMLFNGSVVLLSFATMISNIGGLVLVGGNNLSTGASVISSSVVLLKSGMIDLVSGFDILSSSSDIITSALDLLAKIGGSLAISGNNLLYSGTVLSYASGLIKLAAYGLLDSSSAIINAGNNISSISGTVISSISSLYDSSVLMVNSGTNFRIGAVELDLSSSVLLSAIGKIGLAGSMLIPASIAIYAGITWLEFGINRFMNSVESITKISVAVGILASSFASLGQIPAGNIGNTIDSVLVASSNIDKLGGSLSVSAIKLDAGVVALSGPADRLIEVLNKLNGAMREFGGNISVNDDLLSAAESFEEYAMILEKAAERVQNAVNAKSLAVLKSSEQTGAVNAVKSQVISTVQVLNNDGGGQARSSESSNSLVASAQLDVLKALLDKVASIATDKKTDISEIVEILRNILPALSNSGGLNSEFNNWGG